MPFSIVQCVPGRLASAEAGAHRGLAMRRRLKGGAYRAWPLRGYEIRRIGREVGCELDWILVHASGTQDLVERASTY